MQMQVVATVSATSQLLVLVQQLSGTVPSSITKALHWWTQFASWCRWSLAEAQCADTSAASCCNPCELLHLDRQYIAIRITRPLEESPPTLSNNSVMKCGSMKIMIENSACGTFMNIYHLTSHKSTNFSWVSWWFSWCIAPVLSV